ncbi:TPA: flavodoxin [Klebsiella quasipneumoniae subsp. similipneumoniae]
MVDQHNPTRRMLLTAMAGMTLASVTHAAEQPAGGYLRSNSRILMAYFSRSGNTRVVAGVIHRSLNTDLFEIEPAVPYPEDYFQTVDQAKNERAQGIKPALKNTITDLSQYQTVYLGFPVWGTSVPPVVQSFLATHDLRGKQLIPVITHGGYGKGDSDDVLAQLAPTARHEPSLVIECDQERRTTETVTAWLAKVDR